MAGCRLQRGDNAVDKHRIVDERRIKRFAKELSKMGTLPADLRRVYMRTCNVCGCMCVHAQSNVCACLWHWYRMGMAAECVADGQAKHSREFHHYLTKLTGVVTKLSK